MSEEILIAVVRESVSLFVLLIVLVGGYRLLDRFITVVDARLKALEQMFGQLNDSIEDFLKEVD